MYISITCTVAWSVADVISSPSYSSPVVPYWNATVMLGFFLTTTFILSALRRTVDRENSLARGIQEGLLPRELPRVEGYEIAGAWLPAQTVSGGHYDVVRLEDDTVALCIGDVAGHGIAAALLMSNLQAAVRMLAPTGLSPRDLCARLNQFIISNTTPQKFITFFYAVLDLNRRELVCANAGHHPPIVLRKSGCTTRLVEGGLPLGVRTESGYLQESVCLEGGDLLVIFTEGVLEARNLQNEQFNEERLLDVLQRNHSRGATATCNAIVKTVSEFSRGNFPDGLTLLTVFAYGQPTQK